MHASRLLKNSAALEMNAELSPSWMEKWSLPTVRVINYPRHDALADGLGDGITAVPGRSLSIAGLRPLELQHAASRSPSAVRWRSLLPSRLCRRQA